MLARRRPKGVLVSSDSNPEEIALVAAAHALSLRSVFISHAFTTSVSPPLQFSLSIVEGEAALDAYRRKGPVRSSVYFVGIEGESQPMEASRIGRTAPRIGIFPPKVVNRSAFERAVRDSRRHFGAERIIVRWHPSMLGQMTVSDDLRAEGEVVETNSTDTLQDVVELCDWIITDAASNANIDILKRGVPAIALDDFGALTKEDIDIYGFVSSRILYPPTSSIADIDPRSVMSFYDADWTARFRSFDASYLQSTRDMEGGLVTAIREVLDGASPEERKINR